MKALVTGGEGFIGSHVVDLLIENGFEVSTLDDESTGNVNNIKHLIPNRNFKAAICDITFPRDVLDFFRIIKPDVVFHLAAQASITHSEKDPSNDMAINGIGTMNVIRAARAVGTRRIIFASTSAVYPSDSKICTEQGYTQPESPYGISKLAAEHYLSLFGKATVLRLGNVYGPRQVPVGENQVIARMMRHLRHGDPFTIHGDGKQKRDFVYVKDVAKAFLRAVDQEGYKIYNIASGVRTDVNTVGFLVSDLWPTKKHYIWDHDEMEDPRRNVHLDVESAKMRLDWFAETSLIEGLRQTVEWWRERK